jgi:CheY-like chemotaxis protein
MGRDTKAATTVLLVDDVDEYRNLIKRGLERKGYRVKTASDESDAIERARCVRPDVILLEMGRTPALRTLDTGRRIRSDAGVGDEVKVVVYADRADETVSEGGEVRVGPHEYVILPEDGEQWEDFLGRLLTG